MRLCLCGHCVERAGGEAAIFRILCKTTCLFSPPPTVICHFIDRNKLANFVKIGAKIQIRDRALTGLSSLSAIFFCFSLGDLKCLPWNPRHVLKYNSEYELVFEESKSYRPPPPRSRPAQKPGGLSVVSSENFYFEISLAWQNPPPAPLQRKEDESKHQKCKSVRNSFFKNVRQNFIRVV